MLARALASQDAAERRAEAVSMEETGFALRAPAPSQPVHARSFAHRAAACGMMQCGLTWLRCRRCLEQVSCGCAAPFRRTVSSQAYRHRRIPFRAVPFAVHVAVHSAVPQ